MPVYINTYIILIPHEHCNEHCKLMSRESASSPYFYSVYKFTISKMATSCKNNTNVLTCAIIVSSLRGGR